MLKHQNLKVLYLHHPKGFYFLSLSIFVHFLLHPNIHTPNLKLPPKHPHQTQAQTPPTQHHHHHARGKNSAKNVCGSLALYDWLVFGTLAIETERPAVYGWRQSEREQKSALYRYFNTDLKPYLR